MRRLACAARALGRLTAVAVVVLSLGATLGSADNTYEVTVPEVVGRQLNALVRSETVDSVTMSVRQGCRSPATMRLNATAASTDRMDSRSVTVAEGRRAYKFTLPDCQFGHAIYSMEVVITTSKGGRETSVSCGEDTTIQLEERGPHCCDQSFRHVLGGCSAALPNLDSSSYLVRFNASTPFFSRLCATNSSQLRVRQYCDWFRSDDSENVGSWVNVRCGQETYVLTTAPCNQPQSGPARTVKMYEIEFRDANDSPINTCLGRVTEGLTDPASQPPIYAGNARVFLDRPTILNCTGETDRRLLPPPAAPAVANASAATTEAQLAVVQGPRTVEEATPTTKFGSCLDVLEASAGINSGVFFLWDERDNRFFRAYCDMRTAGGGWMLVYKQQNFRSGAVFNNNLTDARGNAYLQHLSFNGSFGANESAPSLLDWGSPAEMMFMQGSAIGTNWFITQGVSKYQEWTDTAYCLYRPRCENDAEWIISPQWNRNRGNIWQDTDVMLSAALDPSISAITIGRFRRLQRGPMCVEPQCHEDRHGRFNGQCQDGSRGEGNWLVFTRQRRRTVSTFTMDPIADKLAGIVDNPVFWYPNGWDFVNHWSFDSGATEVGDFNADGFHDFVRMGATYAHFFIGYGERARFYTPIYRYKANRNLGWDENVWTTLQTMDLDGDGASSIVRATRNRMIVFNVRSTLSECWHLHAVNQPEHCISEVEVNFPSGWDFSGPWHFQQRGVVYGDFNGDKRVDFGVLGTTHARLFVSRGKGEFNFPLYNFPVGMQFVGGEGVWTTLTYRTIDFNGDGRGDFMRTSGRVANTFMPAGDNETCWYVNDEVPDSCFRVTSFTYPHGWNFAGWGFGWSWWNFRQMIHGDFNGDGRWDYARLLPTYAHFFIGRGDGTFTTPIYVYPHWWNFGWEEYHCTTLPSQDYDGDGRYDFCRSCWRTLYCFFPRGTNERCWNRRDIISSRCFKATEFLYPFGWNFYHTLFRMDTIAGDFNGDDKGDFIWLYRYYAHEFLSFRSLPQRSTDLNLGNFQAGEYRYPDGHNYGSGPFVFDTSGFQTGDINGDRLDDFFTMHATNMRLFITNPQRRGTFFVSTYNFQNGLSFAGSEGDSLTTLRPMDLNGDGRRDIVRLTNRVVHSWIPVAPVNSTQCWLVNANPIPGDCFAQRSQEFPAGWSFTSVWSFNHPAVIIGDFNGDRRDDFMRLGATYNHVFISRGNGEFFTPVLTFSQGENFGWDENTFRSAAMDIDGDGRMDFARFGVREVYSYIWRGDNSSCFYHNNQMAANCTVRAVWTYPFSRSYSGDASLNRPAFQVADFNGDGRSDWARLTPNQIHFYISNGNGSFSFPLFQFPPGWWFSWNEYFWATLPAHDYDGDGRADLLRSSMSGQWQIFTRGENSRCWFIESREPDFMPERCIELRYYQYHSNWWFDGTWHFARRNTMTADFNGDGKRDIIKAGGTGSSIIFMSPTQRRPDIPDNTLGRFHSPYFVYPARFRSLPNWWFNSPRTVVGDFNGDGKDDYAMVQDVRIVFFIAKPQSGDYFSLLYNILGRNFGFDEWRWHTLRPIDLDGNGRADLVRTTFTSNVAILMVGANRGCFSHDGDMPADCLRFVDNPYPSGWSFHSHWHFYHPSTIYGDFNGDGFGDFARLGASYMHFFISKGDGTFFMPHYVFAGGNRWFGWDEWSWTTMRIGDTNGDGLTDIMRTWYNHYYMYVANPAAGNCWNRNDRMPDNCYFERINGYNGWWFWSWWHFYSPSTVFGDFNGDGRGDFARLGPTYIHFFASNGDGSLSTPYYMFPWGWNFGWWEYYWTTFQARDYDGDGRSDIARAYHQGLYIWHSRGDSWRCWEGNAVHMPESCFHRTWYSIPHGWWFYWFSEGTIFGDFNGDGKADFMNLLSSHGAHQFLGVTREPNPFPTDVGFFSTPLVRYRNTFSGDWHFSSPATLVGDFNGDNRDDFARLGPTTAFFFISKGDGTYWQPRMIFPNGINFGTNENAWTSLRALDLNGDVKADFVRASPTFLYSFISRGTNEDCFFHDGDMPDSCFSSRIQQYPAEYQFRNHLTLSARGTVVGDFNGDGMMDFARVADRLTYYFISKGDGTFFFPRYNYPNGETFGFDENVWTTMQARDFDGDGRDDIMRNTYQSNRVFFSQANQTGCWQIDNVMPAHCMRVTSFRFPHEWHFSGWWGWNDRAAQVGDFNGDGMFDFAKIGPTYVHFFISHGNGNFSSPIWGFPAGWNFGWGENWVTMQIGDFDGDGRFDFGRMWRNHLWSFFSRGADEECWNVGTSAVWRPENCIQHVSFNFPQGWWFDGDWTFNSLATIYGDFNGDGKQDFINLRGSTYGHQFLSD